MGTSNSKLQRPRQRFSPIKVSAGEAAALKARVPKCQAALVKLLETVHKDLAQAVKTASANNSEVPSTLLPHIGVLYSGGGWRAMTSAAAATDALSEVGILDTVEVAAGLSGGSWFVTEWALGGKDANVLHDTTSAQNHPWAYGNTFDPKVHRYDGLKRIMSDKVVRRAAKLSPVGEELGRFAKTLGHTDVTFFTNLLFSKGGHSFITRYASFLQDQLFVWASTADRPLLSMEQHPTVEAIHDGTFPMLVCAIIDTVDEDNEKEMQEIAGAQKGRSPNIWCEFSPFGARHTLCEGGNAFPISRLAADVDHGLQRVNAGRMVAMCGSAFAVDHAILLKKAPSVVGRLLRYFGFDNDPSEVVLHHAKTDVYIEPADTTTDNDTNLKKTQFFGSLRDAGLDFNIPFPVLLEHCSGRHVDILLALDAGMKADSAFELSEAVRCGYIEIQGHTAETLKAVFPSGTRVQVFAPPPGKAYPIIIYALMFTTTESFQVAYSREEVDSVTALAADIIKGELVQVFSNVLCHWVIDKLAALQPAAAGVCQETIQQLRDHVGSSVESSLVYGYSPTQYMTLSEDFEESRLKDVARAILLS